MVATAPSTPSSLAGPPAQGRSASRSASDRRGAIEVLPENAVFGRLAGRRPEHAVAASCIGRARPHHRDSHRGRRRFSGQTRGGRYSWARYYDTSLHRFVSEDPLLAPLQNSAFAAASGPCRLSHDSVWILPLLIRSRSRDLVQLLNAYAYVGDSSVNRRDPTGLRADPACLGKCRLSYAILCSLACDVFIEIPPVFIACNAACFAASELECDKICEKK